MECLVFPLLFWNIPKLFLQRIHPRNEKNYSNTKYVGPIICYAFMQMTGLVNDHGTNCFRPPNLSFEKISNEYPQFYSKLVFKPSEFVCSCLSGGKCLIYQKRPIMCIAYPLVLAYGPNCKMYVSLINCPGVQCSTGRTIDKDMVCALLANIEKKDSLFLKNKKELEAKLDEEYFERQLLFRKKIGELFGAESFKGRSLAIKGKTMQFAFLNIASDSNWWKKVEKKDLQETIKLFGERMEHDLQLFERKVVKRLNQEVKRDLEKGKTRISMDDEEKVVSIDDSFDFQDLFGHVIRVKPRELIREKQINSQAETNFQEHIQEILQRVGGGAPIDLTITELVVALERYCTALNFYSKIYALGSEEIDVNCASRAITNLDTKTTFSNYCLQIHELVGTRGSHMS